MHYVMMMRILGNDYNFLNSVTHKYNINIAIKLPHTQSHNNFKYSNSN